MFKFFFNFWRKLVSLISSEWILTINKIPNGGPVIIMRCILSGFLVFMLVIAALNALDPATSWTFSFTELKRQALQRYTTFGVIFAATYTLLYARFSSQWTYLANLYNKIKETEVHADSNLDKGKMAEWKAGFIEDADLLHLVCKTSFVSIVKSWGEDLNVKDAFDSNCRGGESKFNEIMSRVDESIKIIEDKIERQLADKNVSPSMLRKFYEKLTQGR